MKNEDKLKLISSINDEIIERTAEKRAIYCEKTHVSSVTRGKKKNLTIVALAAALILVLTVLSAMMVMYLGNQPELPTDTETDPPSVSDLIALEKTAVDGNTDVYKITYPDGETSTLRVTCLAPEGSRSEIVGITVDEVGDFYIALASGDAINMGSNVGISEQAEIRYGKPSFALLSNNGGEEDEVTNIAEVKMNEEEQLSYTVSNGQKMSLGKVNGNNSALKMARINEQGELVLGFASGETINLGRVVGKDGKDGVGIQGISLSDEGNLSVSLTNGTTLDLGNVKGQDGVGIASSKINDDGELVLTYTDGSEVNVGKVVGEKGEDGVGIGNITLSESGDLSFTLTDGTTLNVGNVKGEDGKSAYELYKDKFGYEGTEEEWLFDLVNGNLATKIKYTVTFDSAGGTPVDPQEVEEGGKASEPERPTRDGYTFLGWYLGDDPWKFAGYSVTENITLVAKWEIDIYKITMSINLGYTETNEMTYTVNDEIVLDAPYSKGYMEHMGYTFVGWIVDGESEPQAEVHIPVGSVGDRQLTAVWQESGAGWVIQKNYSPYKQIWNESTGSYTTHNGIDISCKDGEEAYAYVAGTIAYIANEGEGLGAYIRIVNEDLGIEISCYGVVCLDGLKIGDRVQEGDVIGHVKKGSYLTEAREEPHICLIVLINKKSIDPKAAYIKPEYVIPEETESTAGSAETEETKE